MAGIFKNRPTRQPEKSVVEGQTLLGGVAVMDFTFDILLCSNQGGLGELLVVTGNLNLLAVLGNLLQVVVEGSEFLELLVKLVLHLAGDLVGAFGDDAYGLVDIAGILAEIHHVTGDGVERGVCLLVVHLC